jgi:hypothetical protein
MSTASGRSRKDERRGRHHHLALAFRGDADRGQQQLARATPAASRSTDARWRRLNEADRTELTAHGRASDTGGDDDDDDDDDDGGDRGSAKQPPLKSGGAVAHNANSIWRLRKFFFL